MAEYPNDSISRQDAIKAITELIEKWESKEHLSEIVDGLTIAKNIILVMKGSDET